MRHALIVLLAAVVGFPPAGVCAQSVQSQASGQATQPDRKAGMAAPAAAVEALGLSLDRIKRELGDTAPSGNKDGLKLDFYVEVIGQAPPIQIFQPGELTTGPVPWGAPTHADFLAHVTPEAFKAPAVPISSLAIMGIVKLAQWQAERERRRKVEEERRLRDEELKKKYPYLLAEPKK